MRVGDFEIKPVYDGEFTIPAALMFPNVAEDAWFPHKQFLDENGTLTMDVGGFLITGGDRVVLVDIGYGETFELLPKFGGKLLESLQKLGYTPDQVTDVVFTHLHFDHIGWASREGRAVFPNATYRCNAKDWDYFVTRDSSQGTMAEFLGLGTANTWLGPVHDRFEPWDGDASISPGIDVRDAPGHSPGSSIIVVSSKDERALLLGDAVHCPVELVESEWEVVGDVDLALARRTREALAKEFEGSGIPMAAPHFPGMQFGRLLRAEGRQSWVFD